MQPLQVSGMATEGEPNLTSHMASASTHKDSSLLLTRGTIALGLFLSKVQGGTPCIGHQAWALIPVTIEAFDALVIFKSACTPCGFLALYCQCQDGSSKQKEFRCHLLHAKPRSADAPVHSYVLEALHGVAYDQVKTLCVA